MSARDEGSLIARIAELARAAAGGDPAPGVTIGIGDDAALLAPPAGHELVATVDDQVEGVHFRRGPITWEDVGWRAAAASLSDLAAMGARPAGALSAVAIPADVSPEQVVALHRGALALLGAHGCPLVGGNVTRAPRGVTVSLTALGWVETGRALRRDGGRAGDVLLVTGAPGAARAGLISLGVATGRPRRASAPRVSLAAARERFCRPRPRLREGRWLAERGAHAAIDLSDGLAIDAGRLAERSGVGLLLERTALAEVARGAPTEGAARALGEDPLALCLRGGEDYELLVAVCPSAVDAILAEAAGELDVELRPVGRLSEERGAWIAGADGERAAIDPFALGHDHLRAASSDGAFAALATAGDGASAAADRARRRAPATLGLPWFFYGTLADPAFRARTAGSRSTDLGAATLRGRAGKIEGGYRAVLTDPPTDARIEGRLVRLEGPASAVAASARRLDEYEGEPYRRVIRPVTTAAGERALAWCYVVPPGRAGEVALD